MAENKDGQEKSEQASDKRLSDAKERGQVSKSMDITTSAVLLLGGSSVFVFGGPMVDSLMNFMGHTLENAWHIEVTYQNFLNNYTTVIGFIALLILPIISVIYIVVLTAEISQVGFNVATKKFSEFEDFKKIYQIGKGLKKIFFSSRSIFELVKNFSKVLFLGLIIYFTISGRFEDIVSFAQMPFFEIGSFMSSIALEILLKMGIIYIVIAIADYIYQKWKFSEDMKMTKQEVKDERKQMEGDPKVKAQLRGLMRQRIRKLMVDNVGQADVVITNPTHFAVAIKYDPTSTSAPILLAKGLDFIAAQIREKAKDTGVPIVENPPLARAIFHNVDIDNEIPEELFKAVAEVLAYVYALKEN
ncbi:flagellar biosynthesis protein FlhB [Candidatus Kapabacteria bacterium]|nr:flagellar biosynthesis protein FlhB [Candidatus Kapabacteria bacterium]